jgi:hypothetical protein
MKSNESVRSLTDGELLSRLSDLVRQSRRVEAELIAHIGEVDARRLYASQAASSMFVYCTRILHLSEAEAYLRISVARATRKHPELLTMLAEGRLHLSGAGLIAPHLTDENRAVVLARAAHRSKRQIEELVAELAPRPELPATIRRLPEPRIAAGAPAPAARADSSPPPSEERRSGESAASELCPDRVPAPTAGEAPAGAPVTSQAANPQRAALVQPITASRYRVQFTAREALRDKLERLQALVPGADLATLIEQAVTEKLERLEARRFARSKAPRKTLAEAETAPGPRYIPAPVRRAVYERDGGRCGFVDDRGRRCDERSRLEFHHRVPHGYGGDRSPENIALRCKAHNNYLAEIDYGKAAIARHRRGSEGVSEPSAVYAVRMGQRRRDLGRARGHPA